ncbi:MAG: hypothetical protein L6W00_29075 [Lentisphaeria bacterium]|nr:MAG: hypothetical protein L6W00_29075 [Lentisphaeria bacterium]
MKGQPTPPEPAGELLRVAPNFRLLPGREVKSSIECRNPARIPLKLALAFHAPTGLAVTPASRTVTIPPGETRSLSFAFRAEKECRADALKLDVTAGTLWKGSLPLRLETVIPIPAGNFSRGAAVPREPAGTGDLLRFGRRCDGVAPMEGSGGPERRTLPRPR